MKISKLNEVYLELDVDEDERCDVLTITFERNER